jgi:predicted CoA-binding protein
MTTEAGFAQPGHEVASEPRRTTRGTALVRGTLLGGGVLTVLLGLLVWPGNVHGLAGLHVVAGFVVIIAMWATAWIARRTAGRGTVAMLVGLGVATWLLGYAQHVVHLGAWTWAMVLSHAIIGGTGVVWASGVLARTSHEAARAAGTTQPIAEAATEFLARKRIAVTGVSRNPGSHGSNVVYRRLRERGYQVFAINPHAGQVEGDRAYPDLRSIPGGVEAVVIATRPDRAMATVRECADLGIRQVWMHRAVGTGSVSEEAAAWARQSGLRVIAGGCPLMFDPAADGGHKVMRSVLTLTGKVPRRV